MRAGHLRPKQLNIEISLHASVSGHQNIIRFHSHGSDAAWIWLCLELAEGGDLFDKIEADEGVGEDVAHFYFTQLVAAIGWCHGKGVAHRDIKPENMLLSREGNLKLADFGLATQFMKPHSRERKMCQLVCGSPPYIAPEILEIGRRNMKRKQGEDKVGYDPQTADIWSCAIVLFVLLVGNTPWDQPIPEESYEFYDYVRTMGRPEDELWTKLPPEAASLVRGMLKVGPAEERFTLDGVKKHPWFTRSNPQLNAKGLAANPVHLATQMLESLHIDFNADVSASQRRSQADATDVDTAVASTQSQATETAWLRFASTQPDTPVAEPLFDWEAPPRLGGHLNTISASQPVTTSTTTTAATYHDRLRPLDHTFLLSALSQDPSMSQFAPTPSVPLTLTQQARNFADIVPSHTLARFVSALPLPQLLALLLSALHRLSIPVSAPPALEDAPVSLRVKTVDARKQPLWGTVLVERVGVPGQAEGVQVLEVRFLKGKGDPLEWRRLFKQVAVLCKDGVVLPL